MTDSAAMETAPLEIEHAFYLFMARNWLAIGSMEDAIREFEKLPREAQMHPEAQDVRRLLQPRRE